MDVEFVFCGDTMLAPDRLKSNPFAGVQKLLRAADIAFCNLECSLGVEGPALAKRHVISSASENLECLEQTGFSIVNVANNHILDRGELAFQQLIEQLSGRGIQVIGLRSGDSGATDRPRQARPVIVSKKGVKIGLLGYADYGFRSNALMPLRERIALDDVTRLKREVDCVIVSLHWGYEYTECPSPEQQRLAHKLIESGADMIIGHHPHVVQGIEEYKNGVIAYSLGNFQFRIALGDCFLSSGTGLMLRVKRSQQGRLSYEALPTGVSSAGEVELVPAAEASVALHRLAALSKCLNGKRISRLQWLREASRLWFPVSLESWFFKIEKFGPAQIVKLLQWWLRPETFCCSLLYLFGPKHASSRGLFQRRA